MRCVFLDFDGVVMTQSSYLQPGVSIGYPGWGCGDMAATRLDRPSVRRVSELCTRAGAQVVLSTNWRSRDPSRDTGLIPALRLAGLDGSVPVVGQTPRLYPQPRKMSSPRLPRGVEIKAWLDERAPGWTMADIVILDDEPLGALEDRWVRSTWEDGFTNTCLRRALRLWDLNKEEV